MAKEPVEMLRSPKPLPQPKAGEPAMGMNRLADHVAKPEDTTAKKFAKELLARTGPLVLDGVQYRLEAGEIKATPREYLGVERLKVNDADIEPVEA
jgi:hypothetical protein